MKKIVYCFVLVQLLVINLISYSQTPPSYSLIAKNFNRTAQDSIVFDVYIIHTNPSAGNFEYSLGQYFFRFNPDISNGGTLTYRILGSDLPTGLQPRNPSVSGNELRLATNSAQGAGNGYNVSSNSPGTLVVRMSLKTSASGFNPSENLNLIWKNSDLGNPYTKVFAYVGTVNAEITNAANHIIDKMVSLNSQSISVPDKYDLSQNYPNPFNPNTIIRFSLPDAGNVELNVYDIRGRIVRRLTDKNYEAGNHEIEFKSDNLSSGIYYYRIAVNGFMQTKKMTVLK